MRSNRINKGTIAEFLTLPEAAKEKIFREFDREFIGETFGPLSPRERAVWRKARVAKVNSNKNDQVLIPLKRKLLEHIDEYAKSHRTTRSKLIAKGLKLAMSQR